MAEGRREGGKRQALNLQLTPSPTLPRKGAGSAPNAWQLNRAKRENNNDRD
jgi:hypothetical protein